MANMRYDRMRFVKVGTHRKTGLGDYSCRTVPGDIQLGRVRWYSPLGAFTYFPETHDYYSAEMLKDIALFIQRKEAERMNMAATP